MAIKVLIWLVKVQGELFYYIIGIKKIRKRTTSNTLEVSDATRASLVWSALHTRQHGEQPVSRAGLHDNHLIISEVLRKMREGRLSAHRGGWPPLDYYCMHQAIKMIMILAHTHTRRRVFASPRALERLIAKRRLYLFVIIFPSLARGGALYLKPQVPHRHAHFVCRQRLNDLLVSIHFKKCCCVNYLVLSIFIK